MFEFSESISLLTDQIDILDFVVNSLRVLDERATLGDTVRVTIMSYGSSPRETVVDINVVGYPLDFYIEQLNIRVIPLESGDASGLAATLAVVRNDFRHGIVNDPSVAHAVIVLKHSLAGADSMRETLDYLYWFMDQAVPVIIVGESKCGKVSSLLNRVNIGRKCKTLLALEIRSLCCSIGNCQTYLPWTRSNCHTLSATIHRCTDAMRFHPLTRSSRRGSLLNECWIR